MAAYRAGITKVIIPFDNVPDLDEVDAVVKEKVEFIPVKTVEAVWAVALEKSFACTEDAPEKVTTPEQVKRKGARVAQ